MQNFLLILKIPPNKQMYLGKNLMYSPMFLVTHENIITKPDFQNDISSKYRVHRRRKMIFSYMLDAGWNRLMTTCSPADCCRKTPEFTIVTATLKSINATYLNAKHALQRRLHLLPLYRNLLPQNGVSQLHIHHFSIHDTMLYWDYR